MKKVLSLVLLLAMLVSTCAAFASVAPVSAAAIVTGDLNNDGKITAVDSLLLRKLIVGTLSVSANEAAADLNSDGRISVLDLGKMKSYLSGAIDSFDGTTGKAVKEIRIGGIDISEYEIIIMENSEFPEASFTVPKDYYSLASTPDRVHPHYLAYEYSTKLLRNYISSANGYTLNITTTPTKAHQIYFVYEHTALGEEGYRWETKNGNLYLTGGSRRGSLYGVLDFLSEYIGWRFLDYGVDYCFPADLVNVPAGLDKTYTPPIEYREVHSDAFLWCYNETDAGVFLCLANKVNSHSGRPYMSNPKQGWGEGNIWINAHSFEYIFGIGASEQPCLSNPYNVSVAANWAINLVRERSTWENTYYGYHLQRVSSSWNDNENYCSCSSCMSTYQAEHSIAGTIVKFNNQVTSIVNSTYPEIEVYYIAYGSARIPPINVKPVGNQVICYCWNGCNNHKYGSDECSEEGNILGYKNWEERYYFEAWSRIAPKLFVWYYATSFNFNIGPCPNVLNIREDFRYLAEQGVVGYYAEGTSTSHMSFEGLRSYLMAQCMWDPYMSEAEFQQHIDEYLMVIYGDGWRYIKEYLYIADEAGNRKGCFVNNFDWPGDMYDITYMYENYDKIVNLFDSAYALGNDTQKNRIEQLSMHMHFLAISGAFYNGHGGDAVIQSRYSNLYNLIIKHNFNASIYGVPSSLNLGTSPMVAWTQLEPSGSWYDWYDSVNREYPRDNPNYFHYFMPVKPTKTFNPFENLGK